jgi:hypothetical protein
VTEHHALPPTHREAIREIFLRRLSGYTTEQAAQLLQLTLGDFLALVERGVLDVQIRRKRRQPGEWRQATVSWNELASAAMLRWTVMQIHDALGKDADRALPRLLHPVELKSVRLPRYQLELIERLARNAGVSVEEYVYTALLGIEAAQSHAEMEQILPGFREAIEFPDA